MVCYYCIRKEGDFLGQTFEKSAASKEDLLQIMYQNVETRKAAYEKYKTERLEDLKNNSIDKYAADIDLIYKSYAVEEDKEVAVEEGDKA